MIFPRKIPCLSVICRTFRVVATPLGQGLERFETKEDEGVLTRQPGGAEDWDSQWLPSSKLT